MPLAAKSLRPILIAIVLAVNIFVIGVLAYALDVAKAQQEREVRTAVENVAVLLDHDISETATTIDLSLRGIAEKLEGEMRLGRNLEDYDIKALLEERQRWTSGIVEFRVLNASGAFIVGLGVKPQANVNLADHDYFIAHRDHKDSGLIVSNPVFGRVHKGWLVSFSRRYNTPDGSFAGIISGAVPVEHFARLLSDVDLGPHGVAVLRDAHTGLIARYPPVADPSQQIGTKAFSKELAEIMASGAMSRTYHAERTGEGVERTLAYRRLSSAPFHLVAGMSPGDYLAPWRAEIWKAIGLIALFLLATTGSAALLWRSVSLTEKASERSRLLLRHASDGIHILDRRGDITDVSDSFCRMLGYTRAEMIGMNLCDWDAKFSAAELTDRLAQDFERSGISTVETRQRRKDGSIFDAEVSIRALELDGQPMLYCSARDITERKKVEAARLASEVRYRSVFETSLDAISISRLSNGAFVDVNTAFLDSLGYERDDVLGRTSRELDIWVDPANREEFLERVRTNASCRNFEARFRRKGGQSVWGLMSASVMELAGVACILSVTRDISDIKLAETQIRDLAFYDPLTRLPNRRLLMDRLRLSLAASARDARERALFFVDLDNFKTLNDTLGHENGDLLLKEVAKRLATCVRESDTVARLGGDEFVVMLEGLSGNADEAAAEAETVGGKILAAVGQPYQLAGHECRSTPSIGITMFGDKHENIDDLLKQADIAMYRAKESGRNTMRFFSPSLQVRLKARAAMEEELRQGMRSDQFVLYYQPQMRGDRLTGVEALLRWKHPKRGIVPPEEFIPLAEETGLILPLGNWVLETACRQIAAWGQRKETADITLAVNVSARQFRQPNFVDQVLTTLDRSRADPRKLKLELTETLLVENVDDVIDKMTALKSHAVKFSLDDFGTGYSSLSYLKRLPLDELKIDRSFVRDVVLDASDRAIAQAVIALGRAMGLSVIAEGVETTEQRDFLTALDCHSYQGYLFGRPQPLEQLELLKSLSEKILRDRIVFAA